MAKDPTLFDVVSKSAEKERLDIHTALPGRVVSFNAAQNTVTVEPMITQVLSDGGVSELPPLADVPVSFPKAGGFVITLPIAAGDEGLIIFNERCIDGWWVTGNKSAPMDARMHDYSDAVFIPGISSLANVVPDVFTDGISMQTVDGSTYIRLAKGKILIKGDLIHEGDSHQTGNYSLMGNLNQQGGNSSSSGSISAEQVISGGVALDSHTHSGVQSGSNNTGAPNK